jgi:hypothetical protein
MTRGTTSRSQINRERAFLNACMDGDDLGKGYHGEALGLHEAVWEPERQRIDPWEVAWSACGIVAGMFVVACVLWSLVA